MTTAEMAEILAAAPDRTAVVVTVWALSAAEAVANGSADPALVEGYMAAINDLLDALIAVG